jgi:hypothetical protein
MSEMPESFTGGFIIHELTDEFKEARHEFIQAKKEATLELPGTARKYRLVLDELIRRFESEKDILSKAKPLPSSSYQIQADRMAYVGRVLEWARSETDALPSD